MSIKINLQIFLFVVIFYLTGQIELYGIVMLFAFIHELGHVLCGILLGLKPKTLHIMPFGLSIVFNIPTPNFNTKIKRGNLVTLKKMIIALAGPMMNLFIVVVVLITKANLFGISNEIIIYSNIMIGLFNLLPIYPLDGGRLLKNAIHLKYGLKEAIQYSNVVSNVIVILLTAIGSIAVYYFKNIAVILIVGYLWAMVLVQNKQVNQKMKMYEIIEKNSKKSQEKNLVI